MSESRMSSGPSIRADRERVAAVVVRAVDQGAARTGELEG
jgi:hypothetical protein